MSAADPRVAMLAEMREPAYRLGMAFAAEAEQAADVKQRIEFFQLFDRCFFSVRVAIGLELRLKRTLGVGAQAREPASDREYLVDGDRPERLDAYEPEYDRERDRETERASFPLLIRTLEGVVADAARLPGPEPADLPSLRELLAHMKAAPQPAASLKAHLAASGGATAPPAPRPASNVGQVLAARRATGPPRR